jgi:CDP-glucose 4,6-dehydratase
LMFEEPKKYSGSWNFAPSSNDFLSVEQVLAIFSKSWGKEFKFEVKIDEALYESKMLMLDSSKSFLELNWTSNFNTHTAIKLTADWYKSFFDLADIESITLNQISSVNKKFLE